MLVYIHERCGKPAYRLTEMPEEFGKVLDTIRHLDGTELIPGASRVCEQCKKPIHGPLKRSQIQEVKE